MAKEIKKVIKLHIQAGKATPAPPVVSISSISINIAEFWSEVYDATKIGDFKNQLTFCYADRSYEMRLHEPPASQLKKH
jgi:large subunit ribosomal protein L11